MITPVRLSDLPTSRLRWLIAALPVALIYAVVTFVLLSTLFVPYGLLVGIVATAVLAPISHLLARHFHETATDATISRSTIRSAFRTIVAPAYRTHQSHVCWHLILCTFGGLLLVTILLGGLTIGQVGAYWNGNWIGTTSLTRSPLMLFTQLGMFFPLGTTATEVLATSVQGVLLVVVGIITFLRGVIRPALYTTASPSDASTVASHPVLTRGAAAAWHDFGYLRHDPLAAIAAGILHVIAVSVFGFIYWVGHMAFIVDPAAGPLFGVQTNAITPAPFPVAIGYALLVFSVMLGVESLRRYVDAHIHGESRQQWTDATTAITGAIDRATVVRWVTVGFVVVIVVSSVAAGVRLVDYRPYDPDVAGPTTDPQTDPLGTIDTGIDHLQQTGWTMTTTVQHYETQAGPVSLNASQTALPPTASRTTWDSRMVWETYIAIDRTDNEFAVIRRPIAATNATDYDAETLTPNNSTSLFIDGAETYTAPASSLQIDPDANGSFTDASVPRDAWTPGESTLLLAPPPYVSHLALWIGTRPYGLVRLIDRTAHFETARATPDTVTYRFVPDNKSYPRQDDLAINRYVLDGSLTAESPSETPVVDRRDEPVEPQTAATWMAGNTTGTVHVLTNTSIRVTVDRETGQITHIEYAETRTTYRRPDDAYDQVSQFPSTVIVTRHNYSVTATFDDYGEATIAHGPPEPNPATDGYRFMADLVDY